MDTPETHYARRGSLHIGYQVWGKGDIDILDVGSGTYISIDDAWEQPQWQRYSERLAACGRLIRFDPTGIGLSDSPADLAELTHEGWVDDALAVMDAVGSVRTVVLGASSSSLLAILLAAAHPERTASLVVVNGSARYLEAEGYSFGIPHQLMDEFRAGLDPDRPDEGSDDLNDLRLFAPSAADDPEFQRWWTRGSKRGAAPANATVLSDRTTQADVRALLPGITVPTLIVHRSDALAPSIEHGRYLAEHIPGARLVTLPGDDVIPYVGDLDALVDEIQEFVTGDRYPVPPDRFLATVLVTDIVGSTASATRVGDRRWTQMLRDHDTLARRQVERFGGRFVKDTGDGLVATFDGPARAIGCALSLRDGAGRLGLQLRAGLHAGEIERRGEDVGGIAVHVAARVATSASAGEILVSNVVVDLVEGAGIEFDDRGDHELKGVTRPRHLWAVLGSART
jgi:class 3 adenylate cyclase